MTDSKNTGDKTISVAKPRLTLKRGSGVERDSVRQTFSHGRTNTVQVERKKRRVVLPGEKPDAPPPAPPPPAAAAPSRPPERPRPPRPAMEASGGLSRTTQQGMDRHAAARAGLVL